MRLPWGRPPRDSSGTKTRFLVELKCVAWSLAYPWGFPLLLVPFYKVFGLDFFWLKMAGAICYVLFFLDNILSDILFSTLCVILVGRAVIQRYPTVPFPTDYMLLGTLLCIAFLIRNNGALLIIFTALAQLVSYLFGQDNGELDFSRAKGLWRLGNIPNISPTQVFIESIPYITFFCLPELLDLWDTLLVSTSMVNLGVLERVLPHQIPSRVAYHIAYYLALPKKFFSSYLLYATSVPFVLIGIRYRYRSDYHILLYMALILLLHVIWPGTQGLHYIFPLLPFYASFLGTGIEVSYRLAAIFGKRIDPRYLIAATVITLSLFAAETGYRVFDKSSPHSPTPAVSETGELFRFIKHNTDAEDIIVFSEPRAIRLMTGRTAISCHTGEDISPG